MFTVTNLDKIYNSPLIGNGQLVTTIGPTGYHNGLCPEEEKVNRTIFWAGRRLSDARSANIRIPRVAREELIGCTIPLIRFGRLYRSLQIDGQKTLDETWEQTMDMDHGMVISRIDHGAVRETTESLVCLVENVLIFHTCFENSSTKSVQLSFKLTYEFGDDEGLLATGTRLYIRRPHPDDLIFGNVEGVRSLTTDLAERPPHVLESLSVQYEIEKHLGEVHLGRYPNGIIRDTITGGEFIHELNLSPNETGELWFWIVLSDRMMYSHFPKFEQVMEMVDSHKKAWPGFWETSRVEIEHPALESLRKSCLYTLRCNASPWTIPPGYLSTHWEGRTFHDEFYPFLALISSNHQALAERIPNYRLSTLSHAQFRSGGRGTNFGWEVTETGEESAPYGHWVDEQFRHGQISEQAWRYYLHTGDVNELERFYPVIKGCAEWLVHDVLRRDENGNLTTRMIADLSEHVTSAKKSLFVLCATLRSLQNAILASGILGIDTRLRQKWQNLMEELRHILPVDEKNGVFRYAEDVDLPLEPVHLGMVYPFSFDLSSDLVKNTMRGVWREYHKSKNDATSQLVFSYNWIWAASCLATICFYLGMADEGYQVLQQTINTVGPFMAPNEHFRADKGPFLPWFTTGAGAYVYALNAMFVQVYDHEPAILFPALPTDLKNVRFKDLLASSGVTLSGQIRDGQIRSFIATSKIARDWSFRIPQKMYVKIHWIGGLQSSPPDRSGLITCQVRLKSGANELVQ